MLTVVQELYEGLTRNANPPRIDWSNYDPPHPSECSRSPVESRYDKPVPRNTWERSLRLGVGMESWNGKHLSSMQNQNIDPSPSTSTTADDTPSCGQPMGMRAEGDLYDTRGSLRADDTQLDYSSGGSFGKDSFAQLTVQPQRRFYEAQEDDALDQHVAYYFQNNDATWQTTKCIRISHGIYEINNRNVRVEWYYENCNDTGYLLVRDGPLSQPFCDYVEHRQENEQYTQDEFDAQKQASIQSVPVERRISFSDQNKNYSRLEAMRVAKEQAKIREQAAKDYQAHGGFTNTSHFVEKYQAWHVAQLKQDAPTLNRDVTKYALT